MPFDISTTHRSKSTAGHLWFVVLSIATLAFIPFNITMAADTPSNEELYKMFLELKKEQEELKEDAARARAEAAKAKEELELTRQVLDATQEKLNETENKMAQTDEKIAHTEKGLAETKAEIGTAPSSSVVRIHESEPGPYANVDFIFKRPENDRLTYALITNDSDGLQSKGVDIETEYEPGFRLGLGYLFDRGTEGFIQFSYLDTSASDSVSDPGGDLELNPKLVPEEEVNFDQDEELDTATASYDIGYHVVDAGFAQNLGIGDQLMIRLGGGIRFAAIDDDLSAFYVSGSEFVRVKQKNDFWAIGPRATLDVNWNIPNSGFSIFGMVGGSLLYGENDFLYSARDDDDDVVSFENEENHVYSVLEAGIGAGYSGISNTVRYNLRLGYEFETWLDALSSATYVDDTTDQLFTREDTNLVLHGLFLRANVLW